MSTAPSAPRAARTPPRASAAAAPSHGPGTTISRWLRAHLTDEWLVVLLAVMLSISFFAWYDAHGLTTAFNDARLREMIARRVLMSRTPGLAQLGTTWLPLPLLLMVPLIWDGTLFRYGLAGSLPAMAAYVVAALYMYRCARLLSSSRAAGWVAAGVLALNPSLLYMQGTPMSETASVSALVVAVYYALVATRTYRAADIVKCALAVAAGTLIRYENWVLALAFLPILAYVGWRRRGYALAESWTILYGILAFAGCAAWMVYNAVIFHDPLLSFFYGNRSHTYYANAPAYLLPARHHALTALAMYGLTAADTVGWALAGTTLAGLAVFACRNRLRETALPAYLFLVPFAFYWLALYEGVNTETLGIPGLGAGQLYNVRFGMLMIPAAALFTGLLSTARPGLPQRILPWAALAAILVSGIVGSMQTPFVVREALHGSAGAGTEEPGRQDAAWLASHYHGGTVLVTYVNSSSMIFYLLVADGFPDRTLITDTNGPQFVGALARPQRWATWIVMDSDASNGASLIWTDLHGRRDWRRYFILVRTSGTTQFYELRTAVAGG